MKIFVICGKAQSGKNEVARIIKDYYNNKNEKTIITAYSKYLKIYAHEILDWNYLEETKPRTFLQDAGMKIREEFGEDFLINRLIEDIYFYQNYAKNIIISDARLPLEIELIKEKFTNVISIYVKGKSNTLTKEQKEHITELALDNYQNFDYVLENFEGVSSLKNKTLEILNEVEDNEY